MIASYNNRKSIVASSREDAWIETIIFVPFCKILYVASSREDAWIETSSSLASSTVPLSRPPARTRGLKLYEGT